MAEFDYDRQVLAEEFQSRYGDPSVLSPIQARLLVRCLQTTWEVERIRWSSEHSESQFRDARRLLHAADILEETKGPEDRSTQLAYQRAAELLEWLSRSNDKTGESAPLELMSAAAYQLAGLPAMANGILKPINFDALGLKLYSDFLRGDFDSVISGTTAFWQENIELTHQDAGDILNQAVDGAAWYFTIELIRSLGLFAYSLRVGHNQRLERSVLKLKSLSRIGQRILSADMSLVVHLFYQVARRFAAASAYTPLRALAGTNLENQKRVQRLARRYYNRGRGTLWSSQQLGLSRLINNSSFALCTPTGSGKTLVANLAIVKELLLKPNKGDVSPLALYLVPSRALAGEVEAKLAAEMRNDVIVTGLYGGNDWGITDYWLEAETPAVIIATVEKADALLRNLGPLISARLTLLILDEAHQIVPSSDEDAKENFPRHSERSLRLEGFVSRLLAVKPDIARIALTAVAGGAAGPVARWIEGDADASPIGLNYRSTRQIIGKLETIPSSPPKMKLDLVNGAKIEVRGRGAAPYINIQIDRMPLLPATMRSSLDRFNQLSVLWTSLHLTVSKQRILISITQQPERTMGWFVDALELEVWDVVDNFTIPNKGWKAKLFNEVLESCIDYCGPDAHEVRLLKSGIASSHGQMPQRIRRLMNIVIEKGICPITVATATLTEGVNLPFDVIFVPLLNRSIYNPLKKTRKVRPMTTSEFRNLSGRAGRPGASRGAEGMTFVAVPQAIATTANKQKATQRRQQREFELGYDDLIARLSADETANTAASPLSLLLESLFEKVKFHLGLLTTEEFLDWLDKVSPGDVSEQAGQEEEDDLSVLADTLDELDGLLLAAIEDIGGISEDALSVPKIEHELKEIWSRTFSAYAKSQEKWLKRAFVHRGKAIIERIYPDAEERRRLYLYGFTPYIGRRFETSALQILKKLKNGYDYATLPPEARLAFFGEIGDLLLADRGFGFSIRDTETDKAIFANWKGLLSWWFAVDGAIAPDPKKLRACQRFVNDNLEFRLGVAVGAVVSKAWNDGAGSTLTVPSLEDWKETTGLPWIAFWARELLRWGTHDPFIAFCLSQGLSGTREEAGALRKDFEVWLSEKLGQSTTDPDSLIDPKFFQAWRSSRPIQDNKVKPRLRVNALLIGTEGQRERYDVLPIILTNTVKWIDPAGYLLAESDLDNFNSMPVNTRSDYQLITDKPDAIVQGVRSG